MYFKAHRLVRRDSVQKKIIHVITGLRRGGAEGVLTRLVCATGSEFRHVVVSLSDQGHFGPSLQNAGVRVHALDIGGRHNALAGMAHLVSLIRRERPTIVQTWLYHADLFGGIAARLAGVRRVIWGIRNTDLDARAISWRTRLVAKASAHLSGLIPQVIVCNSVESRRAHIRFGYRAVLFHVIANGCDIEHFRSDPGVRAVMRAQLGVAEGETLVGCVARWDPQKDHANLLAALRVTASRRSRLRIVLVGTGMDPSNERLMAAIRAGGLEERTILTGPRDDIGAIMNAIDVNVLSSSGEAFPNVVAEAMACGTPCVVTDVGDAAHIVGDTGWVVPPRNPEALAVAIDDALRVIEQQYGDLLGRRCRERIVRYFGLGRMTNSYCALWRTLSDDAG